MESSIRNFSDFVEVPKILFVGDLSPFSGLYRLRPIDGRVTGQNIDYFVNGRVFNLTLKSHHAPSVGRVTDSHAEVHGASHVVIAHRGKLMAIQWLDNYRPCAPERRMTADDWDDLLGKVD